MTEGKDRDKDENRKEKEDNQVVESIKHNIVISDPEEAERFIAALEEAEKEPPFEPDPDFRVITDKTEIRKMFERNEKRKDITADLLERTMHYVDPDNDPRIYTAREVTFDYGTGSGVRVDFMRFKPKDNSVSGIEKGDFDCFEIKSCEDDFKSGHGLNFLGDFNYLVMSEELFQKVEKEIPYYVGVLVPVDICGKKTLASAKRAKRHDRERPVSEMLLMMYRSTLRDLKKKRGV